MINLREFETDEMFGFEEDDVCEVGPFEKDEAASAAYGSTYGRWNMKLRNGRSFCAIGKTIDYDKVLKARFKFKLC